MISNFAKEYRKKLFPGSASPLHITDPEFMERWDNFAFDEVIHQGSLDERTRFLSILSALMGCQGLDAFRLMTPAALNAGLTPVELKELIYQATAYLGFGRISPFLLAVNEVLEENGVSLPLPGQAATTMETRREKGTQAQVDIFGENMKEFWRSGPEESRHINLWLAENCFGDYYTRGGLDLKDRELITFCFLAAQGGCEPQLTSHAAGNFNVGNGRDTLIQVISQILPYIGYPRSLNALRCVNDAAAQ